MKVKIKGKEYECYTISQLAALSGKSSHAIKKMEQLGVLPKPNIRIDHPTGNLPGKQRLYTVELAQKVAKIFQEENLPKATKRDPRTIASLKQAFQEELIKITQDA